ncbi:MAG: LCP family protein [Lachnospiraceae bacterium]|nr:LCP family protein [Lachnospiraceae bacterium]
MRRKVVTRSEFIIRRSLLILGCILAVVVILAAAVKITTIVGKNRLAKNANTEGPSAEELSDEPTEEVYSSDWQEGWVLYNGKPYEYNDRIRTFLVLGIDYAHQDKKVDQRLLELTKGGQADGIFLVIVNPDNETMKILAVNRDTEVDVVMVGIGEDGGDIIAKSAITTQHAFGGGGEYSCELTRDAVSRLLYDIPIHGYMSVSYQAIPGLNDAVGGVTLTIPEGMSDLEAIDSSWTAGTTVTLKGNKAYDFVHIRDTEVFESQRMRLARQKLYLKSFINQMKAKTKEDITLPVSLYNGMKDYLVSDLTVDTISYMTSEYLGYSFDDDDIYTMEGETVLKDDGFEYFYPDEDSLRELIIGLFYNEVDRAD